MFDIRPVSYVIGLLVAVLGATMLLPMLVDLAEGRGEWHVFLQSSVLTMFSGGLIALASANGVRRDLSLQQVFLLTTGVWAVLPMFGAMPMMIGVTDLRLVDAYFEAMSGMTTTGSTVISGLDELPKGILLWRGILQWLGGLGIVIVAMLFLPVMRVGGMQFFKSEGFDTLGKVLPRALDISRGLFEIYILLTMICALTYFVLGMDVFDATVHALTTVSTGGFSTSDMSFAKFVGSAEWAGVLFMVLASLPFIRLFQLSRGQVQPIYRDSQIRTYLLLLTLAVAAVSLSQWLVNARYDLATLRSIAFNTVSFFTGTGYGSADVTLWGGMAFTVLLFVGAIGGCTGSTGCSIKVFRYQVFFAALTSQLKRIAYPHRVVTVRIDGRVVPYEVMASVISMFTLFAVTVTAVAILLSFTGLPFLESLTAAWTSVFNIGPAFGTMITPSGSLENFSDTAKWILSFAMLMGRLELVAVIVLFLPTFWRA
ncbi:Trk system potassium uptake protein [Marivita lacus]|uniref:Trk system potassium uptake protein n=1 Tax=Marivita lacus TaxID=1323742 RepID=A0ABQ1KS72_9RHOB|nr:TrkH family potassium uptake protein [Marivita lacus]GGC04716.1 Trk system potassium uptake protein [Marivita lacus]